MNDKVGSGKIIQNNIFPLYITCEKTGIHVSIFPFFYCANVCRLSTLFYIKKII